MRLTRWLTNAQSNTAQQGGQCNLQEENSEGNSYALIQRQVAGNDTGQYTITKKRTDKIRSICWQRFHWPQPGTGAGEATGTPWRQTYQQVFWLGHSKRGGELVIHTSGRNWNWLKMVIALEIIVFLAFCSLSLCCCKACKSGTVLVVAPSKSVHNCRISSLAWAFVPGAQSQSYVPVKPTRSKVNAGQWPLETRVDGWMSFAHVYILFSDIYRWLSFDLFSVLKCTELHCCLLSVFIWAGPALASVGPDLKHFCGAPLSGV